MMNLKQIFCIAILWHTSLQAHPLSLPLAIGYVIGCVQGAFTTADCDYQNYHIVKNRLVMNVMIDVGLGICLTLVSIPLEGTADGRALLISVVEAAGAISTGVIGLSNILSRSQLNTS